MIVIIIIVLLRVSQAFAVLVVDDCRCESHQQFHAVISSRYDDWDLPVAASWCFKHRSCDQMSLVT